MSTPSNSLQKALALLFCLALCFGVAALGAAATTPKIATWYATLRKPEFTPPNIVFPIVWNILYAMMAFSLWRLWLAPKSLERRQAIIAFLMQLSLNLAWSWIFFGAESIRAGLGVILCLDALVAIAIYAAWNVDRIAALLLVPYLLWIGYASVLNASIVWLNS